VKKLLGLMGAVPVAAPVVVSVGPLSPDAVSGLALWLKADALSLNDGDPVSTWTDSSGNGRNLTAASTARPTYKTTAGLFPTNKPVVRFDGVANIMGTALLDLSPYTAITVVLVTASVSASASTYMLMEYGENFSNNPAGQVAFERLSTFNLAVESRNGGAGATANMVSETLTARALYVKATPRVSTFVFDKSVRSEQATIYVNGVWGDGYLSSDTGRTDNDSGTAFAAAQSFWLGARHASGTPTLFTPMDVGALLVYGRKLTVRELARLHLWLDDQYDVMS
jgi:hypothetical protein